MPEASGNPAAKTSPAAENHRTVTEISRITVASKFHVNEEVLKCINISVNIEKIPERGGAESWDLSFRCPSNRIDNFSDSQLQLGGRLINPKTPEWP